MDHGPNQPDSRYVGGVRRLYTDTFIQPPIIQDKQKQTKKKKKKEITSKINTELPKTKDEPDEPGTYL